MIKRLFNFILDLLEKKDEEELNLEKRDLEFWIQKICPLKLNGHTRSFFEYQDPVIKKALFAIKNRRNEKILEKISEAIGEHLVEELAELSSWSNFNPSIIIAIPPSNKQRGFNQSEEIARAFQKHDVLKHTTFIKHCLIKRKNTPIQHSLPRQKRLLNLKNSMVVKNPDVVKDKDVILVDDITTTGATFIEGVRALESAGVKKVLCIAIAH